jgi:hypothetical protein
MPASIASGMPTNQPACHEVQMPTGEATCRTTCPDSGLPIYIPTYLPTDPGLTVSTEIHTCIDTTKWWLATLIPTHMHTRAESPGVRRRGGLCLLISIQLQVIMLMQETKLWRWPSVRDVGERCARREVRIGVAAQRSRGARRNCLRASRVPVKNRPGTAPPLAFCEAWFCRWKSVHPTVREGELMWNQGVEVGAWATIRLLPGLGCGASGRCTDVFDGAG